MRLIDADALRKNAWKAERFNPDMLVVGLGFVLDTPTIAPPDWTPCAEGLPEKKGYYLATVEWFVNEKLRRHVTIKRFDPKSENNMGWHVELAAFGERVIAWKPQDEPWTGGLDGK